MIQFPFVSHLACFGGVNVVRVQVERPMEGIVLVQVRGNELGLVWKQDNEGQCKKNYHMLGTELKGLGDEMVSEEIKKKESRKTFFWNCSWSTWMH